MKSKSKKLARKSKKIKLFKDNSVKMIESSFSFFGVNNETELDKVINNTWDKCRCRNCGRTYSILNVRWMEGNPKCPHCGYV